MDLEDLVSGKAEGHLGGRSEEQVKPKHYVEVKSPGRMGTQWWADCRTCNWKSEGSISEQTIRREAQMHTERENHALRLDELRDKVVHALEYEGAPPEYGVQVSFDGNSFWVERVEVDSDGTLRIYVEA